MLVVSLVLCALRVSAEPATGTAGPTPYPQHAAQWPGTGVVRVFGWMKENRKAFWQARERDRHSIVFAGDSLTASWRTLQQDFPAQRIANRGIGGDVSRGLLFRFAEDVLALDPPAVVVLIGTNDLTARQSPEKTVANVRSMLDLARAHPTPPRIFLCTVPPSASPKAPVDARQRAALNEGLKQLAASDPNVTLIDLFAATATPNGTPDPTYFQPDLLHLSSAGHARWHQLLQGALTSQPES